MFRLTRPRLLRRPAAGPAPRRTPVIACPACGSDRICPIDWETAGEHHWWLLMRCGALASLEAERMAADADALTTALELDLVDTDDFAR